MTTPAGLGGDATAHLQLQLLAEPSVRRVATMLRLRCRRPEPWVRAAVVTLHRYGETVAGGDLGALLDRGLLEVAAADRSLARLAELHRGRPAAQLAAMSFGPKLWWRLSGVPVAWAAPPGRPAPPRGPRDPAARDARLFRLAVLGTGLSPAELRAIRVGDAGSLDAGGRLVPDLAAEPLALQYTPAAGGPRSLTFLPFEAREALLTRLRARAAQLGDWLLLP